MIKIINNKKNPDSSSPKARHPQHDFWHIKNERMYPSSSTSRKRFLGIFSHKGMAMLNKTMFAIFLVMFVFFMFFTVLKLRLDAKQESVHFDQYDFANKFFLTFLSNPNCLTVGSDIGNEKYTTIQGVLDTDKLNKYDKDNEDMWCVENFEFLYTVDVLDTKNRKTWRIGLLDDDPQWSERTIGFSLPGIIKYEDGTAHLGQISLYSYFGQIPSLIGNIKQTCLLKKKNTIEIDLKNNIRYDSEHNSLYIDSYQFYPYFSCKVNDFELKKGNNLILVSIDKNNELNIKT